MMWTQGLVIQSWFLLNLYFLFNLSFQFIFLFRSFVEKWVINGKVAKFFKNKSQKLMQPTLALTNNTDTVRTEKVPFILQYKIVTFF
jgi:hypothetical protein